MDKLILTDDQIEKMHKVGLEMLIEFDRICKKEYKTFISNSCLLLESVRDGKFIELGVLMTSVGYNRFFDNYDKFFYYH